MANKNYTYTNEAMASLGQFGLREIGRAHV